MTEGLRERKKRLTRRQLSDTAAQMFMERGFDAVRVAEVADACGVSEKTVFNYFPTKEALVLDRLESTTEAVRSGLSDATLAAVPSATRILDAELAGMMAAVSAHGEPAVAIAGYRRFGDLIRATPSLRAYRSEMMDRIVTVAAEALAARDGRDPEDPELLAAASALLGLWRVQYDSLRRHLDPARDPADIQARVAADVHRAARLLNDGLAALRG